jgi:general secretion pathway protein J
MARANRASGFTLVELLVALFAMALLAVMSWRGLDGMTRAQAITAARADEVLTLQVGLAQWAADLDAIIELPGTTPIDWNGRVLRVTRRDTTDVARGVLVAAWTLRDGRWLRWQSPPATMQGDLERAWQQADQWAQTPGQDDRRLEVAITPLQEWQVFYFRSDAWTNPFSTDAVTAANLTAGLKPGAAAPVVQAGQMPDGVRLVMTLPPGQAISGQITRDWVRPPLGGKSG